MPVVGIRQLARNASAIIRDVSKTRRPTVVTDRGKPVGVIYPFDEEDLEDYILANAPEYVARREQADRDIAEGKTFPLAAKRWKKSTSLRGAVGMAGPGLTLRRWSSPRQARSVSSRADSRCPSSK